MVQYSRATSETPQNLLWEPSASITSCRPDTLASRIEAVERVILAMHEQLDEDISLQDMAEIALLSPFHLSRVFREITGIPPHHFLAALRLQSATKLLLTTHLNVTDVCFEVGYNSLGTFSTQFKQAVGLAPSQLRYQFSGDARSHLESLCDSIHKPIDDMPAKSRFVSSIGTSVAERALILAGLFDTPIARGRPIHCALLSEIGNYYLPALPDGLYYLFAAAFPEPQALLAYMLCEATSLSIHVARMAVEVTGGRVNGRLDLVLRPVQMIDPPILVALPFLLADHLAGDR